MICILLFYPNGGMKMNLDLSALQKNLSENYIGCALLSKKETESAAKMLIDGLISNGADRERAYVLCLGQGFLWHLFSYGMVKENVISGENATALFNRQKKNDCYALFSIDRVGLKLSHAGRLKQNFLRNACSDYLDVTVFAADLSWAYAFTHENGIYGPYFYRRKKKDLPL